MQRFSHRLEFSYLVKLTFGDKIWRLLSFTRTVTSYIFYIHISISLILRNNSEQYIMRVTQRNRDARPAAFYSYMFNQRAFESFVFQKSTESFPSHCGTLHLGA